MRDWIGNNKSAYSCNGASNHSEQEREENDFYATDPKAVEMLLELMNFNRFILEPACGKGHISKVLEKRGYEVTSFDIVDRGYELDKKLDFLKYDGKWRGDIITNPPYKYAKEFVEKALEIVEVGSKVAMFLKLTFLEGKARRDLFDKYPPKFIYVSSNGNFSKNENAVAYAWYIWEKGFKGEPTVRWFN